MTRNYYQERSTSRDDFRRHHRSQNLASSRIDELAMLPLAEKKELIRQLLIEIGTDVSQNDGDPTGDGDQTTIPTVEKRDVARHLFAAGGDIREHFVGAEVSMFAMACATGSLTTVQSELLSVKSTAVQPFSKSEELRKLFETRETSMRLSPLLLIVSVGKALVTPGARPQFQCVAKLLLKNGASPVAKDVVGKTIAHYGAGGMATKTTLEVTDMCIRAAKSHHLFGKDVKLQGLKTEEMNGKLGVVGGFDADSNRRAVYLPEDNKEVWIKVENIFLQDQDSKCQPYPLLTDIQDRLGSVSLQEIIIPSEAPGTIVDQTAEFLLKKHNTSIYTEDCDGCSPIQMVSGMGQLAGQRAVSKLVMEAATKKGRETRKARKQEGLTCANCNDCFDESKGEKLLVCSRCKVVRYCGRDCQVQHWKEHKKECVKLSSQSDGVTLGPPSEFSLGDGMSSLVHSLRGGGSNLSQESEYKKPRGKKYNEKFVIKCQGNEASCPLLIYDQTRTCQFYLRPEQKGFKEILQAIRNEPAWQGRKTFMKASFDKSGVCTVYPEKAGVKSHYKW
mmetsp:Transcript_13369/g.20635  ORF Transcript_13369/g.20635 Transcript_13369/m.20635 type:complete len:560 (+) Transcript_13369:125-1804(+)